MNAGAEHASGKPSRDERAGLYVLGLMEEAEAAAFESEMADDVAVAGLVASWRERLAELDATAMPQAVEEDLWSRIERTLASTESVSPASPVRRAAGAPLARRLWNSLPVWRTAGALATAAALVLAVALARIVALSPPEPVMVAVLVSEDDLSPRAVVEIAPDGSLLLLALDEVPVPPGRSLQVWTKWSEEVGPVSLGVLDRARTIRIDARHLPAPQPDQLYEITLEPEAGSPTGLPTGPILMIGRATEAL